MIDKTSNLKSTIEKLKDVEILVFGDLMLDEFLFGSVTRVSPEAPVPILNYRKNTYVLGGAANAAANIAALGGRPHLVGCIGRDDGGERFRDELQAAGISGEGLVIDKGRRTTQKTRIIAHNQHVIRIDREEPSAIGHDCSGRISQRLDDILPRVQGVLISDYQKGLVLPELVQKIMSVAATKNLPVIVDSKATDISVFQGVTVITPNISELEAMSRISITDERSLEEAARSVLEQTDADAVLATRSERGVTVFEPAETAWTLPAHSIEVHDVTGAGDTVASMTVLGLAAGSTLRDSVELANYAAAVVVRKVGTTTASPEEIRHLIDGEELIG